MTHTLKGHPVPRTVTEAPSQEATDAERALLELQVQVDVLALIDENLIRSESVGNGKTVTTRHEDKLGRRLRRSMMFAVVRKS